jgi:Asp/Glu/hydantoin racemase
LPQLALSWELMLPAMTRGERHGLAAAVAAAAPPPVLACFRASARAALAAPELAALAAAVPAVGSSE